MTTTDAPAVAAFKDLCIDAVDPVAAGDFYAALLGLDAVRLDDGDVRLEGPTQRHRIWVNRVPEPKRAKNRVHLDVHCGSIAEIEALGAASLPDEGFAWRVMRDPEGQEFCAFVRDEVPAYRLYEVSIDCGDHAAQSRWWQGLVGGQRVMDRRGFSYLHDIPGVPFEALVFSPVPEPKTVKNRVHIDVFAPTVLEVLAHGATVLRPRDSEIAWTVLADPEGNELCVFSSDPSRS